MGATKRSYEKIMIASKGRRKGRKLWKEITGAIKTEEKLRE